MDDANGTRTKYTHMGMIHFQLNGDNYVYRGAGGTTLLGWLRNERRITSPKDGCSGEGSCGACTVEINGHARLACRTKMEGLNGAVILTTEGLPADFRQLIASLFAAHGAVQCGFCSPGFIMRSRKLFKQAKRPSREEIVRAISPNLCRCTGYIKIVDAIEAALGAADKTGAEQPHGEARIGKRYPKYQAMETALGDRPFVDDLHVDGMLYGVPCFSRHPRAVIRSVDTSKAMAMDGVKAVLTAGDIPGDKVIGLIQQDWPLMIGVGEVTHCISDVLALVVAENEALAREAASLVEVDYEVLEPVTSMQQAIEADSPEVHPGRSNILEVCSIRSKDVDQAFRQAAHKVTGVYRTQHVEHGFLETECALAMPEGNGIRLYSQGQGVYVDRRQIARLLDLPQEEVKVVQVANGGAFGGKEDLSVQGHAALAAWLLKRAVKVHLDRAESIRMHPKRHPVEMEISLACNQAGKLTALRLRALGDTGAYASVGTKVMERVVGHATGAYAIGAVDIEARTIHTNNIASGAMRGFGVPQVVFAIESCIDQLCQAGGFDRWQIRYDNALSDGARTATGQALEGVGLRQCLLAVKEEFRQARYAGIACGIKNSGVGNGMTDESQVKIVINGAGKVRIHHGWTEMGQGIHTMAIQTLHQETGIDPSVIEVVVDTAEEIPTGMTTSSRGTALLGNAIIDAAKKIRKDLEGPGELNLRLEKLTGREYVGSYVCDWTCKPGEEADDPKIHFAYGYAAQVAILNEEGAICRVVAAHDAGKIMNPTLFEGQVQGAVHMGIGYALSEELPMKDGVPESFRLKDMGILRANAMPEVKVIGVEQSDPHGPYGAKGIGEIGMVPTAAAVANAFAAYEGTRSTRLPLKRG